MTSPGQLTSHHCWRRLNNVCSSSTSWGEIHPSYRRSASCHPGGGTAVFGLAPPDWRTTSYIRSSAPVPLHWLYIVTHSSAGLILSRRKISSKSKTISGGTSWSEAVHARQPQCNTDIVWLSKLWQSKKKKVSVFNEPLWTFKVWVVLDGENWLFLCPCSQ